MLSDKRRKQIKAADRRYRERHPEKVKAAQKRWRDANPENRKRRHARFKARRPDYWKRWAKENYESVSLNNARLHWAATFGITPEQYHQLLKQQGGRCAICRTDDTGRNTRRGPKAKRRFFCVDHDHETDAVRGLLCHYCNLGLGLFKDSAKRLTAAADYLYRRKSRLKSPANKRVSG